jgi:hypothetical protein
MGRPRIHSEPLPNTVERILALFKRAIVVPNVLKIEVTDTEFVVTRDMGDDDAPVLPVGDSTDIDVEFILKNVADNLDHVDFDPGAHPYTTLVNTTKRLTDAKLVICGLLAPRGGLLADYFGLEEGSEPGVFIGLRVLYHDLKDYEDKIVVFAGQTAFFNDSTHALIIDPGV